VLYPGLITDIGTLNESSLHAELKQHLAQPGDEFEVSLDGFVIDIRRDDLLIEVQTGSFGAMGRKLDRLLGEYHMQLVHPIPVATYLHKRSDDKSEDDKTGDGKPGPKPRRSPLKGTLYSVLDELVSIPTLLDHPNLVLDVVLVTVDKFQKHDPKARRGRGGWRTTDKKLRSIEGTHRFSSTDDLAGLMPDHLPEPFTTADIASRGGIGRDAAQKLAYCLRALDRIEVVDRSRAGYQYRWRSG
jgi:hypothetical protein